MTIYDIVIISSMALAMVGALVYSYKLFRSRVYPLGFAHRMEAETQHAVNVSMDDMRTQLSEEIMATEVSSSYLHGSFAKQTSVLAPDFGNDVDIVDYLYETQADALDQAKKLSQLNEKVHVFQIKSGEKPALLLLERYYRESLSAHRHGITRSQQQLQDVQRRMTEMEERLRKLEVESVQKSETLADENDELHPTIH